MKKPSLKDLINGKSNTVAAAVATHAKKQTETAKPKAKVAKSEKSSGSGALIKSLLMKGLDTNIILDAVHKAFPKSAAKPSDVAWNKWDLKRKGQKVPEKK